MKLVSFLSLVGMCFTAIAYDGTDTLFKKQWALENTGQIILKNISDLERVSVAGTAGADINWVETGHLNAPKSEIIVAVIDSGVDIDHPDLQGKITASKWNFLDNNNIVIDDVGHGTHVAGVIAANKNNIGIVGASDPRIKIMPIKVLNSQVSGFVYNGKLITDVIADAMIYAIKNGAQVINLSLGWPKLIDTAKVRNAFLMAEAQNVLVVAAAGNNSKDLPTFPCAYESVICVGAVDNRGELSSFSNYGSKVDLVAPGEYIISTFPRPLESRVLRIKNYEAKQGSSQAAPFVTAALASLKLFHPELTNGQARAFLFQSAKPISNDRSHFVKYGALDMKSLLHKADDASSKDFIIPLLKDITEIHFLKSDHRFSFQLPFINLAAKNLSGSVCVDILSTDVSLDKNCFDLQNSIVVSGQLNRLDIDSHLIMQIKLADKTYFSTIVMTRDLSTDAELKSFPIAGASFDDMAIINGERKISKMTRVLDKFHRVNYPEYFFLEPKKQTATNTVVSLLTLENGNFTIKNIVLPKLNRVLSIHRQDLKLNGNMDYFIYALSAKKDQLYFINLDQNLNPLFDKLSSWSMPLTTFEGLPIDGGLEKFDWVLVNNATLGKVLVPAFYKVFDMPELDNSKNILDRVIGQTPRIFYLNPTVTNGAVSVESRVLDNVLVIKNLRSNLGIFSDQSFTLLKTIPQTKEQNAQGLVHGLFSTNDDSGLKYFDVLFSDKYYQANLINTEFSISDSLIYPIMNSHDFILTSLLNRMSAEFLKYSGGKVTSVTTLKNDWENPIISLTGAFMDALFVENRSTVTLIRNGVPALSLPVYRDSSFPGQNFSETLMAVTADSHPGIFVNSTLIFGERLYAMVEKDNDFIRPANLSINIPLGCVPLPPEPLADVENFNYTLLCKDPSSAVTLKFLSMSMN